MTCQVEGDRLPNRMLGHSATLIGHIVYVLHKASRPSPPDRVLSVSTLDCARGIWETYRLKGPWTVKGHVTFLIQDRLFLYGGVHGNRIFFDLWSFDTVCMEWHLLETGGFIPKQWEGYTGHYLECCHGVLLLCGEMMAEPVNRVGLLDVGSMTWSTPEIKGTAPCGRTGHSSCVYYDRIYLFGGSSSDSPYLNDLHVLSTEGIMMWSQPTIRGKYSPAPRIDTTMASCYGKLFVYGGEARQRYLSSFEVFDIFNNQWCKVKWIARESEDESRDGYKLYGSPIRSSSNVMVYDSNRLLVIGGQIERAKTHYMIDALDI